MTVAIDGRTVAVADTFIGIGGSKMLSFDLTAPEIAQPVDLIVETSDDNYTTTASVVYPSVDSEAVQDSSEPTGNGHSGGTDETSDSVPGFGITTALVTTLVGRLCARVTA